MKTPLKYFTTKQKLFGNESSSYLGVKANTEQGELQDIESEAPIVPILPLAFNMSFDLVLAVADGPYSMYEVIEYKVSPKRSIWFSLDSKFDGRQYLGLPKDIDDQKLVKAIAQELGLRTYHADLTSEVVSRDDKKTKYRFQYVRKDLDGQVSERKLDLLVEVKRKYDLGQEKLALNNYPKKNKRNSHGMNHSASQFLALIDIYKATPFTKVGKVDVKIKNFTGEYVKLDHPSTGIRYQSVLGIKIKSLISQLVAGFASGKIKKRELSLLEQDERTASYQETKSFEGIELQNIEYIFDKVGKKLQLREIKVSQGKNQKILALYEFNPSLPDYRYELPSKVLESKVTVSLDGLDGIASNAEENQTKKVFMLGAIRSYNDVDGGSKVVEVLAGNFNKSHVHRFKKTPEWMYARPVTSFIRNDGSIEAYMMNHQHSNHTQADYELGGANDEVNLLRSFNIEWDVRTHRLSRLVVRHGEGRSRDLKQVRPYGLNPGEGLGYILGGTWGSGAAASDKAVGEVCSQVVSGARFYQLSSRTFPVRQDAANFPYNTTYFNEHQAVITGAHEMRIRFDHEIDLDSIALGINGMRIMAGPSHREVGITMSGLHFEIVQTGQLAPHISENDRRVLVVHLKVKQGFGPEISRPTKGPYRQNLYNYSAYAQLDLVVAETEQEKGLVNYHSEQLRKFHLGLPDEMKPIKDITPECQKYQTKLDIGQDKVALISALSFSSYGKKKKQKKARYLRKVHFEIHPTVEQEDQIVHIFDLDNRGELTFSTRYQKRANFVLIN